MNETLEDQASTRVDVPEVILTLDRSRAIQNWSLIREIDEITGMKIRTGSIHAVELDATGGLPRIKCWFAINNEGSRSFFDDWREAAIFAGASERIRDLNGQDNPFRGIHEMAKLIRIPDFSLKVDPSVNYRYQRLFRPLKPSGKHYT